LGVYERKNSSNFYQILDLKNLKDMEEHSNLVLMGDPLYRCKLVASLPKKKITDIYIGIYTVGHKKRAPFIFSITLANIDGFS